MRQSLAAVFVLGAALASLPIEAGQARQGPLQGRGVGAGRGPVRDPGQQPTGTAVIRGRVIAADTSVPLRRAQVRASAGGGGGGPRLATTDGDGRYEFRDLPAGRWEISASKAGYVTLRYGQRRPFEAGRPIELSVGQVIQDADVALPRGAAVTGHVFDEFGDPVAGARVQVLRYQLVQGERRLMPAGSAGLSDDTGAFRVYGLMPGDYYVSAVLRALPVDDPTDASTYAPTYFPGTGSVQEAQRIALGLAQEQGGIDFRLLPVRAVRVTGIALDSAGSPLAGGAVGLLPADPGAGPAAAFGGRFGGGRIGGDGRFTIANVAPGSYTLTATAGGGRGGQMELGTLPLTVAGEDVTGVTVVTGRGTTLSGRVTTARGGSGTAPPAGIQISVQQVPQRPGIGTRPARTEPDGTFELTNVFGRGLIRVNGLPQEWTLQSVLLGDEDVTDVPLEFPANDEVRGVQIVVTNRVTEVSGTVAGSDGRPLREYAVVVFPEDEQQWTAPSRYIRSARPDQQGLFKIRALPPNRRYLAVAVDYLEDGEANDPEFLAAVKNSGTRVALADGEAKAIELKLLQR